MFEDALDTLGGGWGLGAALVVGAGLLVARGGRPMVKGALRGWFTARGVLEEAGTSARGLAARLADGARSLSATVVEQAQDVYAETKAELASRSGAAPASHAEA